MTNREIAQEISNRIGTAPVPFDSVYSIALEIYQELGGEESQFDSVYSILLEILPLIEGGIATKVIDDNTISTEKTWSSNKINSSLSEIDEKIENAKPIKEVSELPEASENKDKLFRLDNGEKDVYAAKLLSSETITTNRLPDGQQIDKAYIQLYRYSFHYKGLYHCKFTDTTVDYYCWFATYYDDDMECDITDVYLTYDNAETISNSTLAYYYGGDIAPFLDEEDKEIDFEAAGNIPSSLLDFTAISGGGYPYVVPAIYNAPESAQIGNAYIADDSNIEYLYTGEETSIEVDGETINVYSWYSENEDVYEYSTKPASEIYYYVNNESNPIASDVKFYDSDGEEFIVYAAYIPQLNAPDSEQVDNAYITIEYKGTYTYKGTNKIYLYDYEHEVISNEYVEVYQWIKNNTSGTGWEESFMSLVSPYNQYGMTYVIGGLFIDDDTYYDSSSQRFVDNTNAKSEIETYLNTHKEEVQDFSTVKYQRTETTEEWGWQRVVTEDELEEKVYEGSATLLYSNQMELTGITAVTFNGYTESDLLNMNDAKVRISFDMSMGGSSNGTITQSGFLSKFVMSMGGVDVPMLMLTFGFMDMATQTFKTLYMVYDTSLSTPAWSVQLQ